MKIFRLNLRPITLAALVLCVTAPAHAALNVTLSAAGFSKQVTSAPNTLSLTRVPINGSPYGLAGLRVNSLTQSTNGYSISGTMFATEEDNDGGVNVATRVSDDTGGGFYFTLAKSTLVSLQANLSTSGPLVITTHPGSTFTTQPLLSSFIQSTDGIVLGNSIGVLVPGGSITGSIILNPGTYQWNFSVSDFIVATNSGAAQISDQYSGSLTFSPVPLPQTGSLLLSCLSITGVIRAARRKTKKFN